MNAIGFLSCGGLVALLLCQGILVRRATAARSGWNRLSRRYPASGRPAGLRFRGATAWINGHEYRDHLNIWISGAGIFLSVQPIFRPAHRAVLLPWDDITPDEPDEDGRLPLQVGDSTEILVVGPAAKATLKILARRRWGQRTWHA